MLPLQQGERPRLLPLVTAQGCERSRGESVEQGAVVPGVTSDHPWFALPDDTIATYNAWDCLATARLAKGLPDLLSQHGQMDFYEREMLPALGPTMRMQARGLPIDTAIRTQLRRQFRHEVRTCDKLLCDLAGHPYRDMYDDDAKGFNPNSDTQVRRWLFGGDRDTVPEGSEVPVAKGIAVKCLGLKPATKTDGGAWSVDQDALVRVLRDLRKRDEPHRPLLYALTHRSRYVKLDEYLEFEVEDRGEGNRVYPAVKLHGTKTMRFAYADPPVHSWAEELHSMVRARPGYLLVKADFAAIEARVAAYLSSDQESIAIFERLGTPPYKHHPDWDVHAAMSLLGFPELRDRWEAMSPAEHEPYRITMKSVYYGTFLYGGEPESAKTKTFCPCPLCAHKSPPVVTLTPERKRQIVDAWMGRHPDFVRWRNRLLAAFQGPHATHALTSVFGLRRYFTTPYGSELVREVYNWPVQHTAAVIKLRALRRLDDLGVPLILDHHDALLAEVPAIEAERTAAIMRGVMEKPVSELGDAGFPVETTIGPSWGELH
jgi:DNA polymerase I-like protein with 3'-5' exonuclease and polymerase domains